LMCRRSLFQSRCEFLVAPSDQEPHHPRFRCPARGRVTVISVSRLKLAIVLSPKHHLSCWISCTATELRQVFHDTSLQIPKYARVYLLSCKPLHSRFCPHGAKVHAAAYGWHEHDGRPGERCQHPVDAAGHTF